MHLRHYAVQLPCYGREPSGKNQTQGLVARQRSLAPAVELSVSHYFLARALESVGMSERDVKVVNTSDADITAAWSTPQVTAAATWNPMLADVAKVPNTYMVYDSSKIPGEILDMAVVNTQVLKDNPAFGKALVGAWSRKMKVATMALSNSERCFRRLATSPFRGSNVARVSVQILER